MSQPFNSYIDELLKEGKLDSSGSFSLDSKKALEKLSAFQLADPSWWVLKVVQAAVASRAPRIDIQLDADSSIFIFEPRIRWTTETVLEALNNPGTERFPGLDHFKSALWNCSLHQGHIFRLELKDQVQAIVGIVGDTHFSPSNGERTALCVSQRRAGEGFLTSALKAAKRSSELQARLAERAYFCEIPLTLNGFGLSRDNFSSIALSGKTCSLVETQCLKLDFPAVPVPYQGREAPVRRSAEFSRPAWPDPNGPKIVQCTSYLSLVFNIQAGLSNKLTESHDLLNWVQDGVITDSEPLNFGPPRCLSVMAYLSASGLPMDLSGSKLVDSPERKERVEKVKSAIVETLDLSRIAKRVLEPTPESMQVRQAYAALVSLSGGAAWMGMDFMAGIMCAGLSAFLFGIAFVPMGWDTWSSSVNDRLKSDARRLQTELKKLKTAT